MVRNVLGQGGEGGLGVRGDDVGGGVQLEAGWVDEADTQVKLECQNSVVTLLLITSLGLSDNKIITQCGHHYYFPGHQYYYPCCPLLIL